MVKLELSEKLLLSESGTYNTYTSLSEWTIKYKWFFFFKRNIISNYLTLKFINYRNECVHTWKLRVEGSTINYSCLRLSWIESCLIACHSYYIFLFLSRAAQKCIKHWGVIYILYEVHLVQVHGGMMTMFNW